MFQKINENDVKSDEGFEVRIRPGRWVIEYEDDRRLLTFGFEFLQNDPLMAVYPSIVEVSPSSPDTGPLSEKESRQSLNCVLRALEFLGCTYELF